MNQDIPREVKDYGIRYNALTPEESQSVEYFRPTISDGWDGPPVRTDESGVVTTPGDTFWPRSGWCTILLDPNDWETPTGPIKLLNPNGVGIYVTFYPWSGTVEAYVPAKIQPGTGRVLSYAPLQFPSGFQVPMPDLAAIKAARTAREEQYSREATAYRLSYQKVRELAGV